jgi:prepilin-type processing-associated H-X9-DG protein
MLCPSNSAVIAETYNDLLAGKVTPSPCVDRLGSRSRALPDGTEEVNPCRQIITTSLEPNSDARRSLVQQLVLEKFYNTNYAASWLLVRSRPLLDAGGNLTSRLPGCPNSIDSQSATAGPLSETMLDTAKVPASNVPLLGCGRTTGSLVQDLGEIPAGSFTAQAFTSGPVHVTTGQPPKFPSAAPREGPNGWWAIWSRQTVQDYRGFAPVHRDACNVLMADGSVRGFQDVNRDGILHNGFPPSANAGSGGNEDLELPANEVFSGAALRSL